MTEGRTVHRNLPLMLTSPILAAGVFAVMLPPLIADPDAVGFVVVGLLALAAACLVWMACRIRLVVTAEGVQMYGLITHRRIPWTDVAEVRTGSVPPGTDIGVILTVHDEDVMCPVPTYSPHASPRSYWRRHTQAAYDDARSAWQGSSDVRNDCSSPARDREGKLVVEGADEAAPVGNDGADGRITVGTVVVITGAAALIYGIYGFFNGEWAWVERKVVGAAIGMAGLGALEHLVRAVKRRRRRAGRARNRPSV